MEMMDCPHCGGAASNLTVRNLPSYERPGNIVFVECQQCGAKGPPVSDRHSTAGAGSLAMQRWGARVD